MAEVKFSVVKLFEGLTHLNSMADVMSDPEKGIKFAAIAIADDESIEKSRKDPSFLNPYLIQIKAKEPEEVADIIANFTQALASFSQRLMPKGPSAKK